MAVTKQVIKSVDVPFQPSLIVGCRFIHLLLLLSTKVSCWCKKPNNNEKQIQNPNPPFFNFALTHWQTLPIQSHSVELIWLKWVKIREESKHTTLTTLIKIWMSLTYFSENASRKLSNSFPLCDCGCRGFDVTFLHDWQAASTNHVFVRLLHEPMRIRYALFPEVVALLLSLPRWTPRWTKQRLFFKKKNTNIPNLHFLINV